MKHLMPRNRKEGTKL